MKDESTAGSGHPDQIGPYKILRLLGEGGMGLVYEAEQRVKLKRRVALKVMKPGLDTKDVLARFEVERQALAMMQHPGIAKVLDAGATDEGRPYFVMELVDGEGLKEYADGQKLSIEDRVKLFIKVCRAVQHAHTKGVIHRDLKPSNILVTKRDDEAMPKIIDFGVAKATGQRLTETTLVTSFGQALGTPAYMSPEQAEASGLDVDTRTDVYSLGVTLYELLVGRLPIDPDDLGFAGFMTQLMLKETDPPTPSTRYDTLGGEYKQAIARFRRTDPKGLRSKIHGDLDLITMKAIEHDRERRYETANGFAMDLERYLRDEPIIARPPSTRYRASKFIRRHTGGVVAGIVVIIGLLLGGALATLGMTRARQAERVAATEAEAAREVTDLLVGLFEVSDPGKALGNTITAREVMDKGVERIQADLDDQPLIQARLLQAIGRVYFNLGLYDVAEPLLTDALDINRTLHGPESAEVAEGLTDLAHIQWKLSHYTQAESLLIRAITILDQATEPDVKVLARSLDALSVIYQEQFRFGKIDAILNRLSAIRGDILDPPDSVEIGQASNSPGPIALRQAAWLAEIAARERSLAIMRDTLNPNHPEIGQNLYSLGWFYHALNRFAEAESSYLEALEINEKLYGKDHTEVADVLDELGNTKQSLGLLAEAESLYLRALAIRRDKLDPQHARLAYSYSSLAHLYRVMGEHERALPLFDESTRINEANFGADNWVVAFGLAWKAVSLRELGRYEASDALFQRAFGIMEAKVEPDTVGLRFFRDDYAQLLVRMGRLLSIADAIRNVIDAQGVEAGIERYRELKASAPEEYYWGDLELNNLGYEFVGTNEIEIAIEIFKLNVETYPDAWNTHDSLGEAYMTAGHTELAIQSYERSLELNPGNDNGRQMLEQMGVDDEGEDARN